MATKESAKCGSFNIMKLDIPYYSQKDDVSDEHWQKRACGIVSLKMVLDFYAKKEGRDIPSIDELIKEGVAIGGHDPEWGWRHDRIVDLARRYGFHAYRQEFKSHIHNAANEELIPSAHQDKFIEDGIKKITEVLEEGTPVIISTTKYFTEKDSAHMLVLTGFEKEGDEITGFYYHDPEPKEEGEGENLFVDRGVFRSQWRKFAIFVYSQ